MLRTLKTALAITMALSCFGPVAAWANPGDDASYAPQASTAASAGSGAAETTEPAKPDGSGEQPDQNKPEQGADNDTPGTPDADTPGTPVTGPSNDPIGNAADQSADSVTADTSAAPLSEESVSYDLAVVNNGWASEGGTYYFYKNGSKVKGWLVTDQRPNGTRGGLERYWLDPSTGALTMGLIHAGGSYWAFGKPDGAVVRGTYHDGRTGYFYYADNDGKLWAPGWHVTGQFTGGELQRYYIDGNAHAAVPGTSNDGYKHFTRGDTGYVARGKVNTPDGSAFLADNDGRLLAPGFHVTSMFGQGLQRYYVNNEGKAALGLIHAGGSWYSYGLPGAGYVLRGSYRDGRTGYYYFADNDGKLWAPGWHVTGQFTGGELQRYYIDGNAHAAVPGTSNDGWRHYTRADGGFVARGKLNFPDGRVLFADNDGRVPNAGWLVTGAYTGGNLQRYYIDPDGATHVGFFRSGGNAYYAFPGSGYVLRGKAKLSGRGYTQIFLADNDGKLADYEGWLVTDKYDGTMQRYRLDSGVAPGFYGAHLGLFSLEGKSYYGREDQGYVVRGSYRAPDGTVYYGNNDGVIGGVNPSGDAELDNILSTIVARKGTDLHTLFNYVASYPYVTGSLYPTGNWSIPFAKEMYKNGGGNCYRYAALFCQLARALGYDASVVSGSVPSRSQGWAPHGWVEIRMNGTTYVCDPDMVHAYPTRNWYMFTYGNAPLSYRK